MAGSLRGMAVKNILFLSVADERKRTSLQLGRTVSHRDDVRYPVPNFSLDSLLSVDQGAICDKNADPSSWALSQVTPELKPAFFFCRGDVIRFGKNT
jgi:hypothetical protein